MKSKMTARVVFIVIAFVTAAYMLYPTIKLSSMTEQERVELEMQDKDEYNRLKSKAVSLGLDLLGGMHVLLEVDVSELMNKLARNRNPEFIEALKATVEIVNTTDQDVVSVLKDELESRDMKLERYYGTAERRTSDQVEGYLREQVDEAIDRALEILRNRVDQFGVTEPTIQKQDDRRIILELAGVSNPERVRKLIGETAKLEFKLLKDSEVTQALAQNLNDFIVSRIRPTDSTKVEEETQQKKDDETTALEELFNVSDVDTKAGSDTNKISGLEESTFEEGLFFQSPNDPNTILVPAEKEHKFKNIIELPGLKKIMAESAGSSEFLWGSKKVGDQFFQVYLTNKKSELGGDAIVEARPQAGSPNDPSNFGKFEVSLTFGDDGADVFSRVTGANIGKRLAIVLDERVYLAPTLQSKISDGRARITGIESFEEARDLSIVLKAGALPAPVKIMEERTVGPTLGTDSIKSGSISAMIGLLIVMIFMLIYYRLSGIVANFALILNLILIMAVMASLGATLTLPGIAGIILTIGMAVDANVLIFERIREELIKGKTIRAALDVGYGKAFITILDANVTTFIAGLVLYTYGSGPIKGFAVTLMIGILCSMFTAIVVTRVIFNSVLNKRSVKKLSI